MKLTTVASAALMLCASMTFAQENPQGGRPPGGPGGPPPPGILGTINMARAGLLAPYFSDAQYGIQQGRLGASRVRIGQVLSGNVPANGIKEGGRSLILGFGASTMLPDQSSFLTFSLPVAIVDEAPNQIAASTEYPAFRLAYQKFTGPNTMFGASLTYVDFDVRTFRPNGDRIGRVQRPALDFRLDYLTKLNDNWGVAGRATYSIGESTTNVFGPGLEQTQRDDRLYLQADLVGNFRHSDLSFVPEDWVLHPRVGASFLRSTLEETQNNFGGTRSGVFGSTEESGSIWAMADLVKEVRPGGGWAPSFRLGVEHVYQDDLDNFIDENTYLIGGIGASLTSKDGNRFQVGYERRQGLNGNRTQDTLVVAYGITF
ncbi:hypothetical protein [Phaeobacter sp. C3_T13_0]|uniref:hypothetical protein n=1 Tax=Phaeobacter cretensis TaxID=3342641 RepID=UPI0039BD1679